MDLCLFLTRIVPQTALALTLTLKTVLLLLLLCFSAAAADEVRPAQHSVGDAARGGGTSIHSKSAGAAQQASSAQHDKRNGPYTTAARAPNIQRGIGWPCRRNMPYMTAQITAQISSDY